ncbi:winged helix-turn-helix domain-containing protein [Candidatus Dojkabacteria bacterium]|nr:winged helix-turn-helix domain-containing protein [Candidatus Dojkabacteria bacterium]
MADFYYPLPPEKLKKRYSPLFEVVRKKQSGSFIGLPESAKSGYLQFLLQEKKIVRSFLPEYESVYKILYFEPIPVITDNPYHWLFQLSLKLEIQDQSYTHVQTEDPIVLLTNIQRYLLNLASRDEHLTIFISRPEIFWDLPREAGEALKALWEIRRQPPNNPLSLVFLLHSKSPQEETFPAFFDPLRTAMNENVIYFSILDRTETNYTIERFCSYFKVKLEKDTKKRIFELTGGYYPLVLNTIKLLNLADVEFSTSMLEKIFENKLITREIVNLWNSLDFDQRIEATKASKQILTKQKQNSTLANLGLISRSGEITSEWISSFILERRFKEVQSIGKVSALEVLKGKELLVYKKLQTRKGEVVTRDEIARILWKDAEDEKYSNWAIDKTISRIRKKLKKHGAVVSIITVRNQGYVLLS